MIINNCLRELNTLKRRLRDRIIECTLLSKQRYGNRIGTSRQPVIFVLRIIQPAPGTIDTVCSKFQMLLQLMDYRIVFTGETGAIGQCHRKIHRQVIISPVRSCIFRVDHLAMCIAKDFLIFKRHALDDRRFDIDRILARIPIITKFCLVFTYIPGVIFIL